VVKRVLLIEDEMLLVMLIEDMLSDLGCTSITVAGSVETAMELIAENAFDLATLDVNLDGTRSNAVAEALSDRGIPFAFATGNDEHGFGKQFGDRPVLNKPFSSGRFKEVLGQLLGDGAA
jgi:CheY-like chemotaxis protein